MDITTSRSARVKFRTDPAVTARFEDICNKAILIVKLVTKSYKDRSDLNERGIPYGEGQIVNLGNEKIHIWQGDRQIDWLTIVYRGLSETITILSDNILEIRSHYESVFLATINREESAIKKIHRANYIPFSPGSDSNNWLNALDEAYSSIAGAESFAKLIRPDNECDAEVLTDGVRF